MTRSTGSFAVTGFDHTRIIVADLQRSRDFYEQYFGFEAVAEMGPNSSEAFDVLIAPGVAVTLVMGRMCGRLVELLQYDNVPVGPPAPRPSLGPAGFTVTVTGIEKAWALATELGINITPRILDVMGTKLFFITDPDGNSIELIEYADSHYEDW